MVRLSAFAAAIVFTLCTASQIQAEPIKASYRRDDVVIPTGNTEIYERDPTTFSLLSSILNKFHRRDNVVSESAAAGTDDIPINLSAVAPAERRAFKKPGGKFSRREANPALADGSVGKFARDPKVLAAREPEPEPKELAAREPEPDPKNLAAREPEPEPEGLAAREPEPKAIVARSASHKQNGRNQQQEPEIFVVGDTRVEVGHGDFGKLSDSDRRLSSASQTSQDGRHFYTAFVGEDGYFENETPIIPESVYIRIDIRNHV